MGIERLFTTTFPNVNTSRFESLNFINDGFINFKKVEDLNSLHRRAIKIMKKN